MASKVSGYIEIALCKINLGIKARVFDVRDPEGRDFVPLWSFAHPGRPGALASTPREATHAYLRLVRELEGQ